MGWPLPILSILSNLWDIWPLFVIVLCFLHQPQLHTPRGCGSWEILAMLLQELSHNRAKDKDLLGFSSLGTRLVQCLSMGAAWDCFSFSLFLSMFPRVFHAYLHVCESLLSSKGTLAACCVVFAAFFRDFLWLMHGKMTHPNPSRGERVRTLHLSSS